MIEPDEKLSRSVAAKGDADTSRRNVPLWLWVLCVLLFTAGWVVIPFSIASAVQTFGPLPVLFTSVIVLVGAISYSVARKVSKMRRAAVDARQRVTAEQDRAGRCAGGHGDAK